MAAARPLHGSVMRAVGAALRKVGQTLDRAGVVQMGEAAYVERLVPSTRVVPFAGKSFEYGYQHFVSSTASIVGDVKFGELSSAWYGATVKGDVHSVTVGKNTNILENAVVSSSKAGPTVIGSDVTICAGATVTSATIGDGAMIGMGARVLPGAKVGNDAFVDAGAVVAPGTVVPAGALYTGNPAKQLRMLNADEMSYLRSTAVLNTSMAMRHADLLVKTPAEFEAEEEERLYRMEMGMEPDEVIPGPTAEVEEYFRLTREGPERMGLLRDVEYNVQAELDQRAEEEIAADAAENAHYAHMARMRRVGLALKALAGARADRPAIRGKIVGDLDALDPEGGATLREVVARIGVLAATGTEETKAAMLETIRAIDPDNGPMIGEAMAKESALAIFNAVAKHAQAIAAEGGAATGAAAVASAAAASAGKPAAAAAMA